MSKYSYKLINEELLQKVKNNDGYCICALVHEPDTKCMCKEFRESDKEARCHCGVYEKVLRDKPSQPDWTNCSDCDNSEDCDSKEDRDGCYFGESGGN